MISQRYFLAFSKVRHYRATMTIIHADRKLGRAAVMILIPTCHRRRKPQQIIAPAHTGNYFKLRRDDIAVVLPTGLVIWVSQSY